ncbi:MAG: ribbon-helix-helix domain-containing protein [Candidatus Njordarchaeum guaymaensis]
MPRPKKASVKVGLSVPVALVEKMEKWVKKKGFSDKAELIRTAIREYIEKLEQSGDDPDEVIKS